jgi:hypothetical protein
MELPLRRMAKSAAPAVAQVATRATAKTICAVRLN